MVGSVIVDAEGNLLSKGFHQKAGQAHAEINALQNALQGDFKEKLKDSTIYVNLEPCCHFGKTPPCTKAIIESGIKKVVIGSLDPNPKVEGKGVKELKENGIEVINGVLEEECAELNKFFFHWIKTKKPWVTLKIAATLDGKIHLGEAGRQITGPETQVKVQELRAEHDAILTGSGTVLADNPQMNVRLVEGKSPIKIVLDRRLRTNPKHKIYAPEAKSLIFTNKENLQQHSFGKTVELIEYPDFKLERESSSERRSPPLLLKGVGGIIQPKKSLEEILLELGSRGILSVLVEAGQGINSTFMQSNVFNELIYFINPSICSMSDSLSATGNCHQELKIKETSLHGNDLMLRLIPKFP